MHILVNKVVSFIAVIPPCYGNKVKQWLQTSWKLEASYEQIGTIGLDLFSPHCEISAQFPVEEGGLLLKVKNI